ncbi:hypothetical protein EMPG_11556, partial [Blastomyces silverae]
KEFFISRTQLHCETVIEFQLFTDTQITDIHTFFDKFFITIVKLEAVNRVEEAQNSKSIAVILNVHLLMKKIQSHLNSLKDKKNSQASASAANSTQMNTAA